MPDIDDALRTLRETFGFDRFREGQEPVISALLAGRSALAVFPTGAGKSLCYQLPALLLDGLTVVVSPLIALMKDQVDFLVQRKVAAARLDSTLDANESRRIFDDLRADRLKLLYVAPERLASERFVETLGRRRIALLAVDEAHCISEWGHNFRPEYLKLARLARELKVERVLALTATATPDVARDVARAFEIASEDSVITGFHRPNLELHATACLADERREKLVDRLTSRPRSWPHSL
jgi:ATP-dependent DNA helicase RecQ